MHRILPLSQNGHSISLLPMKNPYMCAFVVPPNLYLLHTQIYLCIIDIQKRGSPVDDSTTLRVSKKTRDQLADMGSKSETYDQIIGRLIRFYRSEGEAERRA